MVEYAIIALLNKQNMREYKMDSRIKKLMGSNMDIDFSNADFGSSKCPWNEAEKEWRKCRHIHKLNLKKRTRLCCQL